MSLAFTIRTTNRQPSYLDETLRNLQRGGVNEVSIAFGAAGIVKPNQNGINAMRMGIAQGKDWVVFLEDDIDCCADFQGSIERWLEDHARPDVRAYSLGAVNPHMLAKCKAEGSSAYELIPEVFYGSWGIVMRTQDAEMFCYWLTRNLHHHWQNKDDERVYESRGKCFDLRLAVWHRAVAPVSAILVAAPCFINHIGSASSLDNNVGELEFAGREFKYRG